MLAPLKVNLGDPPGTRWVLPSEARAEGRALLKLYTNELGGVEAFDGLLDGYLTTCVRPEHREEMRSVASQLGVSEAEAALGSLYYDAVKAVLGCTAFAVDTEDGPMHARNLDWWTEARLLSTASVLTDFVGGDGGVRFKTLGWPGFVGALSGVAPGRFAITLNAVLSDEPAQFAPSAALLIRDVLETTPNYEEAVERLANTPIASDCLLLVTGIEQGEMVVVERTPTKSALRCPIDGYIAVANDYLLIDADTTEVHSELLATSCKRFGSAVDMLSAGRVRTEGDCFSVLEKAGVQMAITVQHMVLHARSGKLSVRLPKARRS